MFGDEGVQRADFHFSDERGEGLCGDAAAPEFPADPVTHQAPFGGEPASDVPSHLSLEDDGPKDVRLVATDFGPEGHEGVVVARREGSHTHGFGVELMLEEDGEVGVEDVTQDHAGRGAHRRQCTNGKVEKSKSREIENKNAETDSREGWCEKGSRRSCEA